MRKILFALTMLAVAVATSSCATTGDQNPTEKKSPKEMSEIYVQLGTQALLRIDFPQAIEDLNKALTLDATNVIAMNHLAAAYLGLGKRQMAKDMLFRAVDYDKKYSDAWLNLGNMEAEDNHLKTARDHYTKALANLEYKTRHRALTALAQLAIREGNLDEARKLLYQSLQLNPDFCMTHFLLGTILMRDNNAGRAADEFKKSTVSTCATNVEGHFQMGVAYLRSKNYAKAKSAFLFLVEKFPQTLQGQKAGEQLKYIP